MKKFTEAILCAVPALLAADVAATMIPVISEAGRIYCNNCDYLLVLGGDVIGADTPSPQLLERMKRAAEYLNNHPHTKVIPCGGCFRKEQKRSEADIIASYLIENGVEESRIFREDKSTTTFENFEFAAKIIGKISGKNVNECSVAFLSSSYHVHRASEIAKLSGYENIGRVTAPTPGEAYKRYIREYFVSYQLKFRKLRVITG